MLVVLAIALESSPTILNTAFYLISHSIQWLLPYLNPEVTDFINAWATWYMVKTTKRETYTIGSSVWIFKNQAFISMRKIKPISEFQKWKCEPHVFYRKSLYECIQFDLSGIGGFSLPCWGTKNLKATVLHRKATRLQKKSYIFHTHD